MKTVLRACLRTKWFSPVSTQPYHRLRRTWRHTPSAVPSRRKGPGDQLCLSLRGPCVFLSSCVAVSVFCFLLHLLFLFLVPVWQGSVVASLQFLMSKRIGTSLPMVDGCCVLTRRCLQSCQLREGRTCFSALIFLPLLCPNRLCGQSFGAEITKQVLKKAADRTLVRTWEPILRTNVSHCLFFLVFCLLSCLAILVCPK